MKITLDFDFGSKARDKVTGFVGVVTGFTTYDTGCDRYMLTPPVDEKGQMSKSEWVDSSRLESVPEPRKETKRSPRHGGGPNPPP